MYHQSQKVPFCFDFWRFKKFNDTLLIFLDTQISVLCVRHDADPFDAVLCSYMNGNTGVLVLIYRAHDHPFIILVALRSAPTLWCSYPHQLLVWSPQPKLKGSHWANGGICAEHPLSLVHIFRLAVIRAVLLRTGNTKKGVFKHGWYQGEITSIDYEHRSYEITRSERDSEDVWFEDPEMDLIVQQEATPLKDSKLFTKQHPGPGKFISHDVHWNWSRIRCWRWCIQNNRINPQIWSDRIPCVDWKSIWSNCS